MFFPPKTHMDIFFFIKFLNVFKDIIVILIIPLFAFCTNNRISEEKAMFFFCISHFLANCLLFIWETEIAIITLAIIFVN